MWFFLTWKACKKRSWLSLFYDFLLCHCEWGIHIGQTWKYLRAVAILQIFPAHVAAGIAWHQISSSQLYHLRICSHDYHCLCFMIFLFWGIFICFHGYCFLHFGCSCRELSVATLVRKVLAVPLRFCNCVFPRRFPLFNTTNCDGFSRRSSTLWIFFKIILQICQGPLISYQN